MTTLAHFMHAANVSWFIKNPYDTGDSYAADLQPIADAVLTEQCNQSSSCDLLASYTGSKLRPSSMPSIPFCRPRHSARPTLHVPATARSFRCR
jgi:hypothetical protein